MHSINFEYFTRLQYDVESNRPLLRERLIVKEIRGKTIIAHTHIKHRDVNVTPRCTI